MKTIIVSSLLFLASIALSQVNITGNDLRIYQFDKGNMTDNDVIIFTPNDHVIVGDGKLKLFSKFRNNIVRARLRHKVRNGSEIVVKVDNIPFNADGRIKLITSENNYCELMFYDNEGIKSLVISEKILSNDESYIYRKVTPLSTPIHIKISVQKDKTLFSLGYAGRSFDKFFETDLVLDNFMIQLESSTKIDNPYTSVDIDWVIVSTEK
ncbi:MAG: hypothetical protein JXR69_11500 [Candidatus Delongbacteria bacterium]|nr:hypothetical protein [Candidatus Delongbacteria bacterium]